METWRIAQEAEYQWTVYRGNEKHWTQTAQAAVRGHISLCISRFRLELLQQPAPFAEISPELRSSVGRSSLRF